MKVKRIVVEGELPARCYKCDYKTRDIVIGGYVCLARSAIRPRPIADVSSVPDWCPLVLESKYATDVVYRAGHSGQRTQKGVATCGVWSAFSGICVEFV